MTYFGKTWLERSLSFFIYMGALSFPFSVAGANLFFALAIILALFSGQLWQGIKTILTHEPLLTKTALLYMALMLVGLAWSEDTRYGLRVLGYQWIWLIVPLLAASMHKYRQKPFLYILSFSLSLHLVFCVAQMQGWVHFATGGSNQQDATGFIGHIAFGVVYGIWSALLIFWGYRQNNRYRWVSWVLAIWSIAMVFAAQGRSAYLVVIVVLLVVFYRIAMEQKKKRHLIIALGILSAICVGIVTGPGQHRLQATWDGVVAALHGNLAEAQPRWRLWIGSVEIIKTSPWYGVGTGGYPHAAAVLQQTHPELEPHLGSGVVLAHPHNTYVQNFVRFGIIGALLSLILFLLWIRTGWSQRWKIQPGYSMITLSGIAMMVHGLSAPAMEEHFPAMMAAMMLGTGLGLSLSKDDV